MSTEIKPDLNTEYLAKDSEVLAYESGYSSAHGGYCAVALVQFESGELALWEVFQTLDYRKMSDDPESHNLYYAPEHGGYTSGFESEEEAYEYFHDRVKDARISDWMSVGEVGLAIKAAWEYRGERYSRNIHGDWEPNF